MLFLGIGNLIDILKPVKCLFCHRYPVSGWILVNKLFYFKFLSHAFDDIKSTSSILKYPGLIIIFSTYVSIFTL